MRPVDDSERLILAEVEASDRPTVAELARAPGFDEFNLGSRRAPVTDHEVAEWIEFWRALYSRGLGMWCLIRRSDAEIIGMAGVKPRLGHPDFEIKYNLQQKFWGQGYGTEAANAALQRAVERGSLTRVVAVIDPRNDRSRKVALNLGFRKEHDIEEDGTSAELWAWERRSD